MTIGEVIKKYREAHQISQRQFAIKCNVSNGYISMLEKESNPKTGEPIMPSISALKSIASAMCISLNELLIMADDMPVNLSEDIEPATDEKFTEFMNLFQQLTNEQQNMIIASMKGIINNNENI